MDDLQMFLYSGNGLTISDSEASRRTHRPLVLAVDDDEDNLLLMSTILEMWDCSCLVASDGYAALSLSRKYKPDLILLDIVLPKLSGLELVRCLKQDPQTKMLPVVAVTALARPEDRDQIVKAGCNDYLCKPFLMEDLEAVVCRHLSVVASPVA